ncbi:MAG: class I SAM-dependent methyltransferase [Nitrospirae bacterium]|nr:class I SAM-dependent methyltransferase [Nitrospirota bacterium]
MSQIINRENNNKLTCRFCGKEGLSGIYYLDDTEISKCDHCGFIQIGKTHLLDDLKVHYTGNINIAAVFQSEFERSKILRASRFRADYIQKYTGLRSGKVLEVGSAEGDFLHELKSRNFDVTGIEPSSGGAMKSREKGVTVINDLLENSDLPDMHFDIACMFQVIEHFEKPKEVLRLLHSKIKKGGYLVMETPDIYSAGSKFEKSPHKLFNKEHVSYFSPESLNACLENLGFKKIIVRHYDYDGFRMPFMKSIKKILKSTLNPDLEGPLQKILKKEIDIHYKSKDKTGNVYSSAHKKDKSDSLKDFKKSLTAPLDITFGHLAYQLDLGASFFWIGQKH